MTGNGDAAQAPARYDQVADWYVEFTRSWGDGPPLAVLPDDLRGQRVLDQGCAYGTVSRHLALRGALVVGLDLSAGLLRHAIDGEHRERLGIDYVHGDATRIDWWDGRAFDGVVSNMALMDIDDLDGALSTAATVLRPNGWLSVSVFHPCYPGGPEGSWSGLPSWPPERGYACEGWWTTNGEGVRGHVGANHRMVSTYINAMINAGFLIEKVAERGQSVPVHLMVRARRP